MDRPICEATRLGVPESHENIDRRELKARVSSLIDQLTRDDPASTFAFLAELQNRIAPLAPLEDHTFYKLSDAIDRLLPNWLDPSNADRFRRQAQREAKRQYDKLELPDWLKPLHEGECSPSMYKGYWLKLLSRACCKKTRRKY